MLLVLIGGLPAIAQYEVSDREKFGLRVGFFRPIDGKLTDLGRIWMGPSVDWYRTYDHLDRPINYVNIGIYTVDKHALTLRSTPLTYNWIRRFSDEERHWYASGGVGFNFLKYQFGAHGDSGSSTKISLHGTMGYSISDHYFAECQYSLLPKWDGVNWSGITLYAGIRTSF